MDAPRYTPTEIMNAFLKAGVETDTIYTALENLPGQDDFTSPRQPHDNESKDCIPATLLADDDGVIELSYTRPDSNNRYLPRVENLTVRRDPRIVLLGLDSHEQLNIHIPKKPTTKQPNTND